MNVGDIQALLMAAKHFAEAAQISDTGKKKLDSACIALEPFRSMDVAAFTDLLCQAEEYKRTGVLPVAKKATRTSAKKPKATAEETAQQVEHLAKQLHELYAVVHEETVGYGAIDEICDSVNKLNVAYVKKVAEKFGIKVPSRATKPKALEEIKRKLTEQKGSAQRIQPIGSALSLPSRTRVAASRGSAPKTARGT